MVDFLSENVVGTGVDCLWGVVGGVATVSYYKTDLGVIANSGLTSLVPFTDGVGNDAVLGDPSSPNAVAVTGSFFSAVDADTFLAATGMYEGFKGNTRLSAAVAPGEIFYFNCVWDMYLMIPVSEETTVDESSAISFYTISAFMVLLLPSRTRSSEE
jgi:hypothetical protein